MTVYFVILMFLRWAHLRLPLFKNQWDLIDLSLSFVRFSWGLRERREIVVLDRERIKSFHILRKKMIKINIFELIFYNKNVKFYINLFYWAGFIYF